MKRNRHWYWLAVLALLLTACAADEHKEGVEQLCPITFNVLRNSLVSDTRSSIIRYNEQMARQPISLVANIHDDSHTTYFSDILKNSSGEWGTETKYYWLPKNLDFFAYLPQDDGNIVRSSETFNKFTYHVPKESSGQNDLMYATAYNRSKVQNGGEVPLEFKHAFAAISFLARKLNNSMVVIVNGLDICNMKTQGDFLFPTASTFYEDEDREYTDEEINAMTGTWSALTETGSLSVGIEETELSREDMQNITSDNGILTMIPQELTPWNRVPDPENTDVTMPVKNQDGCYLAIHCKLLYNGLYLAGSETEFGTIYMPFGGNFEQGNLYVYSLIFGMGYKEDGTEMLKVEIQLSSTITDWTHEEILFDKNIL